MGRKAPTPPGPPTGVRGRVTQGRGYAVQSPNRTTPTVLLWVESQMLPTFPCTGRHTSISYQRCSKMVASGSGRRRRRRDDACREGREESTATPPPARAVFPSPCCQFSISVGVGSVPYAVLPSHILLVEVLAGLVFVAVVCVVGVLMPTVSHVL